MTTEDETYCWLRRNIIIIIIFMLDGLIVTKMDSYQI
jgi:hypothetical protein